MKVRLTLVLLLASLIFQPLSAEIKIYHRLGDVEEMADIYHSKDENVYVDARSLPEKVRSSITSNPGKFVKIDMRDVLSGRKVSEKGVVTYEQERFARHDSDLYEIVKLKKFLDMNTVADPSAKEKIKGAVEDFKHIGTAEKPAPEVMEAVEKRLLMELDKNLGALDSTTKSELGEEISKAIDTYLVEIEKQKGIVLKAFDSAIRRQQSNGDLEKMKACEAQKQNFLGGTLDVEQIADRTLKAKVENFPKQRLFLQKSLLADMNQEIKAQTKNGNVRTAEAITEKKKELLDENQIEEASKTSSLTRGRVVNVEIWANCDDIFTMSCDGKMLSTGRDSRAAEHLSTNLRRGSQVLVRVVDTGVAWGFSCVMKIDGKTFESNLETWKSYTPKDPQNWNDPRGITGITNVQPGNNQKWKNAVVNAAGSPCTAIWGNGGLKSTNYLMFTIP